LEGLTAVAVFSSGVIMRFAPLLCTALLLGAAFPATALDLNSATAAQLRELKGVGPRSAELIVRERERGGPFLSLQDLSERVRGIGERKIAGFAEAGLTVGQAPSSRTAVSAPPAVPPAASSSASTRKPGASSNKPVPAKAVRQP
ncbi:ComEA family DNA-binding protein, partial [Bordetella avium]